MKILIIASPDRVALLFQSPSCPYAFLYTNATMKLGFLLLLLFMVACQRCNKDFKNDHGLKRHRPSCKPAKIYAQSLLQRRHQLARSRKGSAVRPENIASSEELEQLVETENVSTLQKSRSSMKY